MKTNTKWLIGLGVTFLLGGIFLYFRHRKNTEQERDIALMAAMQSGKLTPEQMQYAYDHSIDTFMEAFGPGGK
ncbi:MAG: LPXTG cell wall anchor domain-containing protein [Alphaproteobacteria bacterium]